jgi:hypothetical protein
MYDYKLDTLWLRQLPGYEGMMIRMPTLFNPGRDDQRPQSAAVLDRGAEPQAALAGACAVGATPNPTHLARAAKTHTLKPDTTLNMGVVFDDATTEFLKEHDHVALAHNQPLGCEVLHDTMKLHINNWSMKRGAPKKLGCMARMHNGTSFPITILAGTILTEATKVHTAGYTRMTVPEYLDQLKKDQHDCKANNCEAATTKDKPSQRTKTAPAICMPVNVSSEDDKVKFWMPCCFTGCNRDDEPTPCTGCGLQALHRNARQKDTARPRVRSASFA